MKTFATLALVLMAAASASATQKELHIQLRVHTHEKLYITPMGKQCAYDAKIDASEYPCRDGGVCVRKNETYGVCELPKSSTTRESHVQMRVHGGKHQKLYITPMGKQCAYNPKIDPAEYPCRDGGVCVRKNETYGVCELPKASTAQHKSRGDKHQKLYITPMGKQCAYDAKIDASEYPCRDGGVCVRKNETYGVCELPGQASNLDSNSGSDDSDSDSLELLGSQDEFDSSDVSDEERDDSQSSADDEESEEDEEDSVDEDDSVDNTIA